MTFYAIDHFSHEKEDRLDKLPLFLTLFLIIQRFFMVSVRHGFVPPKLYAQMSKKPLTKEQIQRELLLIRWQMSDPQVLLDEIDQEMALMMMDTKYFKI